MTLSDKSIKLVKEALDHKCEIIYMDSSRSIEGAEEEVIDIVKGDLKDNFEQACNDYGLDYAKEFGKKGFKEALILAVEEWEFR